MLRIKENRIIRHSRYYESEGHKELNTLQELVDYIENNYHLAYDSFINDNSWDNRLDLGRRCFLFVDAHTDDRGDTYFGSPDFKAGYFDDMDYKKWARSILRGNRNHRMSDDEINELVVEAVNDFIEDTDTYVDYYSKDLKLPCNKRDVDVTISKNMDNIEKIIWKAEDSLENAIKKELAIR